MNLISWGLIALFSMGCQTSQEARSLRRAPLSGGTYNAPSEATPPGVFPAGGGPQATVPPDAPGAVGLPPFGSDPGTEGDGDYQVGPNYQDAPDQGPGGRVPQGSVQKFRMDSSASKIFPGQDPWLTDPGPFSRDVWFYLPAQAKPGMALPLLVVQDGGYYLQLPSILDHLIAAGKVPVMAAVLINPGPGDGVGSQRGLEYDTVSGAYATFIETEVLPQIARTYQVQFSTNPQSRAAMGGSSGAAAAFTMAWFHPEWYSRVLSYSGTFVSQHPDATYPHGAYGYPESLVAATPKKELRVWMEVGDRDNNFGDPLHDWQAANKKMAAALKQQGYHYRFLFANNAGHVDSHVVHATLPDALIWLWRGHPVP